MFVSKHLMKVNLSWRYKKGRWQLAEYKNVFCSLQIVITVSSVLNPLKTKVIIYNSGIPHYNKTKNNSYTHSQCQYNNINNCRKNYNK